MYYIYYMTKNVAVVVKAVVNLSSLKKYNYIYEDIDQGTIIHALEKDLLDISNS